MMTLIVESQIQDICNLHPFNTVFPVLRQDTIIFKDKIVFRRVKLLSDLGNLEVGSSTASLSIRHQTGLYDSAACLQD
jgi:hypothetical protein